MVINKPWLQGLIIHYITMIIDKHHQSFWSSCSHGNSLMVCQATGGPGCASRLAPFTVRPCTPKWRSSSTRHARGRDQQMFAKPPDGFSWRHVRHAWDFPGFFLLEVLYRHSVLGIFLDFSIILGDSPISWSSLFSRSSNQHLTKIAGDLSRQIRVVFQQLHLPLSSWFASGSH